MQTSSSRIRHSYRRLSDTLQSRTTILSSTNSDSAVDFSAGTKNVFCTLPASKAVIEDSSNNVALAGTVTVDTGTNGVPTIELKHSNASADNFRIMGGQTGVSNAGLVEVPIFVFFHPAL